MVLPSLPHARPPVVPSFRPPALCPALFPALFPALSHACPIASVRLAATEIQNIQIADGDVCRNMAIPMHMIFPRLFTCPTIAAKNFKVEFEVNVVIHLTDGHLITENFPIRLVRTASSSTPALV